MEINAETDSSRFSTSFAIAPVSINFASMIISTSAFALSILYPAMPRTFIAKREIKALASISKLSLKNALQVEYSPSASLSFV